MITFQIVGIVLLAIALVLTALLYKQFNKKEIDTSLSIKMMVIDAFFIAIIAIFTFVPNIGFIAVSPFISFTLLHIPVLIGAYLFGYKRGLLYGLAFGICSYIQALTTGAGFNLLFAYPWTAIPPRVLFGFSAGIIFSLIRKLHKSAIKGIYLSVAAMGLALLHTCLVFLDLYIFFPTEVGGLLGSSNPAASGTALTFLAIIAIGMAGEMALAGVIVSPTCLALTKVAPMLRKKK